MYTCAIQAIDSLGAASIVQERAALAHKSVVLPKGFTNTMPASAQALARQHGVLAVDAIIDAFRTVVRLVMESPSSARPSSRRTP